MNRPLLLFLLCWGCVLLSSCVFVSTSDVLDNVGQQVPGIELQKNETGAGTGYKPKTLTLWEKGDACYLELPVVYVPMDCSLISVNLWHGSSLGGCGLPDAEAYSAQSAPQTYYARLTKAQAGMLLADESEFDAEALRQEKIQLLRADEVDMSGARRKKADRELLTERVRRCHFIGELPHERTVGNQLRRPLTWVLAAVDVPLSVGATAAAWAFIVVLGPFM